jgi:hypothetical protein
MLLSRGSNPGRKSAVIQRICKVATGTYLGYPYRPLRKQPAVMRVLHSSRVSRDHVKVIESGCPSGKNTGLVWSVVRRYAPRRRYFRSMSTRRARCERQERASDPESWAGRGRAIADVAQLLRLRDFLQRRKHQQSKIELITSENKSSALFKDNTQILSPCHPS